MSANATVLLAVLVVYLLVLLGVGLWASRESTTNPPAGAIEEFDAVTDAVGAALRRR
jgi:hypothetical protein